jgi:ferredoxin-thioredoxin reductase catalytic subunit
VAPDEEALFREFQAYVRAIYLEANKTVIQQLEHTVTAHRSALAEHKASTIQAIQAHAASMDGLTSAAKEHTAAHDKLDKDLRKSSSELLQWLDAMAKYQATKLNSMEESVADFVKAADERQIALRGLISSAAKEHTAAYDKLDKDLKKSSSELLQWLDAMAKYQATKLNSVEESVADFVKAANERQIALRGLISKLFIGVVVLNIVVGVLVYLLATQR